MSTPGAAVPWRTDADGVLREPDDFHDGWLRGVVVDERRNRAELLCATMEQVAYRLVLSEVIALRAHDFRQGNIIHRIYVHESGFRREHVAEVHGVDDPGHYSAWLDDQMAKMQSGPWLLLRLEASYGCSLVLIARGGLEVERLAA